MTPENVIETVTIRIALPAHLRTLARSGAEVTSTFPLR